MGKAQTSQIVCNHALIGMEIVAIREVSDKELDNLGFEPDRMNVPVIIQLANKKTGQGAFIFPQADPEGNGFGNLLIQQFNGKKIEVDGLLMADKQGNSCVR